jgi:uncharacterized protein (UPF0303 family)
MINRTIKARVVRMFFGNPSFVSGQGWMDRKRKRLKRKTFVPQSRDYGAAGGDIASGIVICNSDPI